MANKKLKVEVELETAKAKQQLGSMGDGVGASSATPSTRSADKLAEATTLNTRQMMSMTRAFSGMALGLAASYSARYFKQGSTEEKVFGYGGSILTGAMSGSMVGRMAGPQGAVIGGVAGGVMGWLKEYFDRDKAKEDATKDYKDAEEDYQDTKAFSDFIKRTTSPISGDSFLGRIEELANYYATLSGLVEDAKSLIEDSLSDGDLEMAADARKELAKYRSRMDAIRTAAEKLDEQDAKGPSRTSHSATDSLMKLGGGFGLPVSSSGKVEVWAGEKIVRLLEDIRANTGRKGSTQWL